MTPTEMISLALSCVSVIMSTVSLTLHVSLTRKLSQIQLQNTALAPSSSDHFAQLEKRLYDLTNQRFGGTVR